MSIAPMYPVTTWECSICGHSNPGDIAPCVSCRDRGSLTRDNARPAGGIDHGSIPYFPAWHARNAGYDVTDNMLPVPAKYPHR